MEEDVATMLQGFDEQREQETIAGAEALNAEQVKLNDSKAEAEKVQASIQEGSLVKIENMMAQNSLEVQRVKGRTYETTSKIITEAERESAELLAVKKVEAETILSAARIQKARNEAKAEQIISETEGKIAPMIEKLKDHETLLKEMAVYKQLADNPSLVISGTNDSDTNLVAVADAIMQSSNPENGTTSAIMAELALLGNITASNGMVNGKLQKAPPSRGSSTGITGFTNGH